MLVARIEITAGPARGTRTFAEVDVDADGIAQSYRPIDHPFEPGLVSAGGLAGPVPAEQAVLLAPCAPRVVLGMAHNTGADDRLLSPQAFHKSPHSVVGPGHPIELEPSHDSVDAEGEIAAVIGRVARNLTPENALDAIYGYTIGNDVTDRHAQATEDRWTEAKSRDTYTPLGPWICTDIDPSDLTIRLGDDDGLTSEGSTSGLARGIGDVLVYITSVLTLHPGDVVLTGAPGPGHRLRPGAVSRVLVPAIGELANPVVEVHPSRRHPATNTPR